MVDAPRIEARLQRLEEAIERLEEARGRGLDRYLADSELRAATEHRLQTAIQICIDLGTQLAMEVSAPAPSSYADVFTTLGQSGVLPKELASRLEDAARLRNLIVRLYLEVDDRVVFDSLAHLDAFRQFAGAVEPKLG